MIVLHVKHQNTFASHGRSAAGDVAMKFDSLMLQFVRLQLGQAEIRFWALIAVEILFSEVKSVREKIVGIDGD